MTIYKFLDTCVADFIKKTKSLTLNCKTFCFFNQVSLGGFEPPTSCLSSKRSKPTELKALTHYSSSLVSSCFMFGNSRPYPFFLSSALRRNAKSNPNIPRAVKINIST